MATKEQVLEAFMVGMGAERQIRKLPGEVPVKDYDYTGVKLNGAFIRASKQADEEMWLKKTSGARTKDYSPEQLASVLIEFDRMMQDPRTSKRFDRIGLTEDSFSIIVQLLLGDNPDE